MKEKNYMKICEGRRIVDLFLYVMEEE